MSFRTDTSDLKVAADVLRQADQVADPILAATVDDLGDTGLRLVRQGATRHTRTGRMLSQVRVQRQGSGAGHTATVRAGGPIAGILAHGSVPHPIQPRHARALQLTGRSTRSFAARVRHPGTRPDPFVERAFDDLTGSADQAAQDAVNDMARDLAAAISRRT